MSPSTAKLHFDPAMISGDSSAVADLSYFESGSAQAAGEYMVDFYVNGSTLGLRKVRFIVRPVTTNRQYIHDSTGLIACLEKQDLADIGVNVASFPALAALKAGQCVSLDDFIPKAYTAFNFQQLRLDISIPQAALLNRPHGWIPSERWDEGINAAMFSYQFNANNSRGNYGNNQSYYLNLTSGLNLGAWRLRDNSTLNDYINRYGTHRRWQHLNSYIQRAIIPWHSELTMGDGTTGGDVFGSLSFRGIQIASDDSMYPDTMRGFAPEIKGSANSNAQVSIRQNGNIIYRTFVAPGAFVIKDLYPVSSGGDLDVIVMEANGTSRTFTVPYSSLPVLQRKGHIRYGFAVGHYRNSSDSYTTPAFAQGTLLWGLPHNITAYSGVQVADRYRALALGVGLNMGVWGAVSADITQADSYLADCLHHEGHSVRLLYGRSLISTGTTFQLAGYRYSSQGFHTLDETALKGISGWMYDTNEVGADGQPVKNGRINYYNLNNNKRESIQTHISQRLGELGSLYLTGNHQTYWQDTTTTDSLQVGFSGALAHVNYNLSYSYSRISGQFQSDRAMYLSLSVPLDSLLSNSYTTDSHDSMWATYTAIHDSDGHLHHQTTFSGTSLKGNNLDWSVARTYGRSDDSGNLNLSYQGGYGNISLGYDYSRDYHQLHYGASGSIILHSGGLTLGQPLSSTNVLIAAPGAVNVPVENSIGIHTDWRGYTVQPYASTYRENRVALDVTKLDDHTDIDNPVDRVIPTYGALVRADFGVHTGARSLMTLSRDGKPLPFGSMVSVADGRSNGLIDDGGRVWLSGLAMEGTLKVQWGNAPDQQCTVHYHLPENALKAPLVQVQETCQ